MCSEYIYDIPGGDTVVLFIHGIIGSPKYFDFFISELPPKYAVHNILLDGHGKNVQDFANTSMEKWKKQVYNTVQQLAEEYKNIVIVAHSMGTLFAIDMSVKFSQVKMIFLLNSPLKVYVKASDTINVFKGGLKLDSPNDMRTKSMKKVCSIALSNEVWRYLGWIPRYSELFKEIRFTRGIVGQVKVPCYVFQSKNDELVSSKSVDFIKENTNFNLTVLENSTHFSYSESDKKYMVGKLNELLSAVK